VYFTATHVRGQGVGAALMRAALDDLENRDLAPCLDVVPTGGAAGLYRRTGWLEVGTTRPSWLHDDSPDVIAMVLPRS
jgi:ribosomal protein S18 acetylase RimI-like enzyme